MLNTLTALAEPNRLRIVEHLVHGPRSVGELSASLQLQQPQVSKHLRALRESGLVTVHAVAQQRIYALRPEPFVELHGWLAGFRALWEERFAGLDAVLSTLQTPEE